MINNSDNSQIMYIYIQSKMLSLVFFFFQLKILKITNHLSYQNQYNFKEIQS